MTKIMNFDGLELRIVIIGLKILTVGLEKMIRLKI